MNTRLIARQYPMPGSVAKFMLLMVLFMAMSCDAANETTQSKTALPQQKKGSKFIYYPSSASPYYDYQDTGAFASRPMVIPMTLPIITQPAYLYLEAPPSVIRSPLPTLATQKPAGKTKEKKVTVQP